MKQQELKYEKKLPQSSKTKKELEFELLAAQCEVSRLQNNNDHKHKLWLEAIDQCRHKDTVIKMYQNLLELTVLGDLKDILRK